MSKGAVGVVAAALALVLVGAGTARAGTIVGGSDLLDSTSLAQLESWLGEGQLTLTNIYTKSAGDDSSDFHGAVDGKGRTFVVLEADVYSGSGADAIIGGYNPQSWHSGPTYWNYTPSLADRTAFLFNLGTTTKLAQGMTTYVGHFQTYNHPDWGPTFGGGYDLSVEDDLGSGYAGFHDYVVSGTQNVFGSSFYTDYYVGKLEVFSISPFVVVPLPASAWAGLGLLAALAALQRVRRRRDR